MALISQFFPLSLVLKRDRLAMHLDQPGLGPRRSWGSKGLCWDKGGKRHGVRSLNLQAVPSLVFKCLGTLGVITREAVPSPQTPGQETHARTGLPAAPAACRLSVQPAPCLQRAVKQALRRARRMMHCCCISYVIPPLLKVITSASLSGEEDWATVGVKASPQSPARLPQMNSKVGMWQDCWDSRAISGRLRLRHWDSITALN